MASYFHFNYYLFISWLFSISLSSRVKDFFPRRCLFIYSVDETQPLKRSPTRDSVRALALERERELACLWKNPQMALKLNNPLASQPYNFPSSARPPISTFRSPKFLCLASSSPALSSKSVSSPLSLSLLFKDEMWFLVSLCCLLACLLVDFGSWFSWF